MLRMRASCFLCLCVSFVTAIGSADVSASAPDIAENQNHVAAGELDHGALTLHLELRRGVWHPDARDGRGIEAPTFAEQGRPPVTPAPLIRVPQGTEIRAS